MYTFFAVICAFILNKSSFAEPANLTLLTEKIQAYHDSGAYQKELKHVMTRAHHFVVNRVQANAHHTPHEKLAIVLDIDETSLSNYDKIVARGFTTNHERIHRDVLAADVPAIKDMLTFYDDALKQGVAVFFVTGRIESDRRATIKNLKQAGYHDWAGLYLKPNNYNQPSIIPFKSQTRAAISKLGYTIIASIGDQQSDLTGGYAEKTFKLPNPFYYLH